MRRRQFLKSAALSATALTSTSISRKTSAGVVSTKPASPAQLPRRRYGKTEIELSVIGLGGILLSGMEQEKASRVVAEFVERGGNYFDVAPTYGNAEHRLGPALEPYRKNVFLACKTTQRRRDGAEAEFKESLRRLRTDYFDLFQLHGISDVKKDVDVAFSKGGVMELLLAAKKSGQVRHLGFSAHSIEATRAALERYEFDSILFPVNFACYFKGGFGPQIVELARRKGAAVLAIKALARQIWPKDDPNRKVHSKCWYQPLTDPREAELGLRFTLSQPVTATVPPGEESLFQLALEAASRFKPLNDRERRDLENLSAELNPIFPST